MCFSDDVFTDICSLVQNNSNPAGPSTIQKSYQKDKNESVGEKSDVSFEK